MPVSGGKNHDGHPRASSASSWEPPVSDLIFVLPLALLIGAIWLVAFLWSLKAGQYEDLDGAAWRVLDDE